MSDFQDRLAALRSRFDDAVKEFPDYIHPVEIATGPHGYGPRIRLFRVRHVGDNVFSETNGIAYLLEGPERIARAERDENAYWRFETLARELEPVLKESGVEFRDSPSATPGGRIGFWAIGEDPKPGQGAVSPNDNLFFLVSLAIDRLMTGKRPDKTATEDDNNRLRCPPWTCPRMDLVVCVGTMNTMGSPSRTGTISKA